MLKRAPSELISEQIPTFVILGRLSERQASHKRANPEATSFWSLKRAIGCSSELGPVQPFSDFCFVH